MVKNEQMCVGYENHSCSKKSKAADCARCKTCAPINTKLNNADPVIQAAKLLNKCPSCTTYPHCNHQKQKGREKPQTIVIEAQGAQHRPLLQQHLGNVEKQISRKYDDLADSDKILFLDILQDQNAKQLQKDLAKLLMSVGQGFVHIIVYDENSVETAIADALNNNNNMRVYYPSETGVDTNAIIKQFVDQLLYREGSWRQPGNPCALFELQKAFAMLCKDPSLEMCGGDQDDGEEENVAIDIITTDDQHNDRARVLMWLEKIDPRFLDFKLVRNLTIDFTQGYVGSIAAQETATISSASSTPKIMNKRARSDDPVPVPGPKKKKKN